MSIVVPAVLQRSKRQIEEQLLRFVDVPAVEAVQIDVVDGRFATPPSWPYAFSLDEFRQMVEAKELLPFWDRFRFDIDLMVTLPEKVIGSWITLGASRLTIHAESTRDWRAIIRDCGQKFGRDMLSFGLALSIATPLATIEPYLDEVDYIQLMGIAEIGTQGQPFDERVLARIKRLRALRKDLVIQIDGGVSLHSAPALLSAGASRLVVGSALGMAGNPTKAIERFDALTLTHGVYA